MTFEEILGEFEDTLEFSYDCKNSLRHAIERAFEATRIGQADSIEQLSFRLGWRAARKKMDAKQKEFFNGNA